MDNTLIREPLRKIFAREIDPQQYPASYLATRLLELKIADRLGEPVDVQASLAGVTGPSTAFLQQVINLSVYARRNDLPALRRVVDGMQTAVLLNPRLLTNSMTSFAKLGMKDELAVAQNAARAEVRTSVAQSWATHDRSAVLRSLQLAEELAE